MRHVTDFGVVGNSGSGQLAAAVHPDHGHARGLSAGEVGFGFVTDVEQETLPPGLDEDVVRFISAKKEEPEWLLEWRLKAYRHWLKMKEPT